MKTDKELHELCQAALADAKQATQPPWRWEYGYNNGGMPTGDFFIPGHSGEATVEMLADDCAFCVNARSREHVLAEALLERLDYDPRPEPDRTFTKAELAADRAAVMDYAEKHRFVAIVADEDPTQVVMTLHV